MNGNNEIQPSSYPINESIDEIGNHPWSFNWRDSFRLGGPVHYWNRHRDGNWDQPRQDCADYQRNLGPIGCVCRHHRTDRRWCSDEQLLHRPLPVLQQFSAAVYRRESRIGSITNGGMGSDAALIISNLWAENYQAALGDDPGSAAGLQIAIWEEVASGTGISFLLAPGQSDYGASTMIAAALAADSNGVAPVSLVALSNTTYQDYVVQNVPDSGMTLVLLGFGLASLAIVGRKARPVPVTTD